ncbi:MAG: hypothetical protein U1F50_02985 [Rubrivivax sp.]
MRTQDRITRLALLAAAGALVAGCGSMGGKSDSSAAPAPAAAAAPAGPKIGPGMNAAGEVVDPKKVEQGYGTKVKGMDDWEGEITGKPVAGSKFTQLKIGMTAAQAISIVGNPTDQGAYMTGKAWIPFYFGSDKYRYEVTYKGIGRLIFASSPGYALGETHLIWIIHSANETGER